MSFAVQGNAPPRTTSDPLLLDNTGAAATSGVAASGNLGASASRSAIDRIMDDNWVPPAPEKPRPPMFALQLAGNSELVRQVNTLLYDKNASPSDIQSVMDLISTKIMELSIDGEIQTMKDRQKRIEANQKDREKELQVAKEKAIQAEKDKEWKKFWGMLKAVGSVLVAAAVTAAGFMTGNPLLVVYGGYLLINATMDVVDAVRAYQDKEPLGFRLTVGELAGWIAKQCGADEEEQAYWNAGTEIVFGIVMTFGASALASGAANASKLASGLAKTAQLVNSATAIAQGINTIQMAALKYEQAESKERLQKLQLIYEQLQQQLEKSQELLKTLNEALMAIWESAADRLKSTNEAKQRVFGGGRRNMV